MDLLWAFLREQGPATGIIVVSFWWMLRAVKEGQAQIQADTKLINSRMDCIEKSQHACQLENAREFATKTEVNAVENRVNGLESRVSRIEGRG